ncbi:MAG: glycosyltransferase family 39 protein [Candidatus Bathyarchaeia archaeon]
MRKTRPIPIIFLLILTSIQMLSVDLRSLDAMVRIVEDSESFAYYSLALRVSDSLAYVNEWLALMQVPLISWGGHLATHYPGFPFLISLGFKIFGLSAHSIVWLTITFSVVSIIPLFYLAKLSFGLRSATIACLLYSWIPSLILGIPYMESVLTFFVPLPILLFNISLRYDRGDLWSILGGLTLAFAIFLALTSAATILALIILCVASKYPSRAFKRMLFFLSGAFLPYLIFEAVFNLPFIEAALWAFRTNLWFYDHLHSLAPRVWSVETSVMLFLFLFGIPLCISLMLRVAKILYCLSRKSDVDAYTLAILAMMLLTFLLARLELARVASFMIPLLIISVSAEVSRPNAKHTLVVCLLLLYSQYFETCIFLSQTQSLSKILGYPVV